MMQVQAPDPRRPLRGNITMFILLLAAFLGFTALAVDIGTLQLAQAQLQAGVDAAALAGASRLDRTPEGLERVQGTAVGVGGHNHVMGKAVGIQSANVTMGVWDPDTHTVLPSDDPEAIDAVTVHSTMTDVSTPFAGIAFGIPFLDVDAHSVALRMLEPTGRLDCFLPVGLPECTWLDMLSGEQGDHHFYMATDSSDNVGWAHPTAPTPSTISRELTKLVEGRCEDGLDTLAIGEPVALNNGVEASTVVYLGRALDQSPEVWDASIWGARPDRDPYSVFSPTDYAATGVITGPVAIFAHDSLCPDVRYNQDREVVAFAWGVIYDVYKGPGLHQGFQLYVDTDHEWEVPYGGGSGSGNVVALGPPKLVSGGGQ